MPPSWAVPVPSHSPLNADPCLLTLNTRSIIIGIVGSLAMLAVLGFSRLFNSELVEPELTLRELEFATLSPPPPPPIEEPPSELAPPPPPTLTQIIALPDPTRVAVPQAELPMDIEASVEEFYADLQPAPLPTPPEPKPPVRVPTGPLGPPSRIHVNQLDGMPRLLSHGNAVFPSSLARRGVRQGTVVLEVEIDTTGKVRVLSTVSSTHHELVPAARRVAEPGRFTPPTYKGRVVKAVMRWPITIKK